MHCHHNSSKIKDKNQISLSYSQLTLLWGVEWTNFLGWRGEWDRDKPIIQHLIMKSAASKRDWGCSRLWVKWSICVKGGDANRWIWSYSLSVPHFTQWNQGGSVPQGEFSAVMSPQLDYKWIDVSMQHQFYPICQFK